MSSTCFQTYAEFQDAHEQLMDLVISDEVAASESSGSASTVAGLEKSGLTANYGAIKAFMRRGVEGGAYIFEPKERRACQALLDYWASRCYEAQLDVMRPVLAPFDPVLSPSLDDASCPYVGLNAFGEGDTRNFFGRTDQVAALLEELRLDHRLIVVTGASGSGKSSLVLAGLIPDLKAGALEDSAHWRYLPPLVPGMTPLEHLAQAIAPPGADADWLAQQATCMLRDSRHAGIMLAASREPVVLVVDQFEEALTLRTAETSDTYAQFVANLLSLVDVPSPRHRVILTMRMDVESMLARQYPELNRRYGAAAYPLNSMEAIHLRDAIEKPAALAGLKFQDGVVDELVKSVLGEDSSLPLLQFSLMALWDRRSGNLITAEAFRAVGSPKQAMATAAQLLYDDLPKEQQIAAEKVFLALSRFGDGVTVFRNRVQRRQLYSVADRNNVEPVLVKFEAARLIRITRATDEPMEDLVDVAHEALLRNWTLLDRLFSDQRVQGERRAFLRKQAEKWREGGFDRAFLLAGIALQQAKVEFAPAEITALEQEFLLTSAAVEQEREQARNEEEKRKLRIETERTQAYKELAEMQSLRAAEADRLTAQWKELADQKAVAARKIALRYKIATVATVIAVLLALYSAFERGRAVKQSEEMRSEANTEIENARETASIIKRGALELQQTAKKSEESAKAAQEIAKQNESMALRAKAEAQEFERKSREAEAGAKAASKIADAKQAALTKELIANQARRLAIHSAFNSKSNSDLSVLLGLAAKDKDPAVAQDVAASISEATRFRPPLWQLAPNQIGRRPRSAPTSYHGAISLSPDGERLAVANTSGWTEWTVRGASAEKRRSFPWAKSPGEVHIMAYGGQGKFIGAATDRGVLIWPADGGNATNLAPDMQATRLAFNHDETMIVAVTERGDSLHAWSLPDGRMLLSATLEGKKVLEASFDRSSQAVIAVVLPSDDRRAFTLYRYALSNGEFKGEPQVEDTEQCDPPLSYAAGGGRLGLSLSPVICSYDTAHMGALATGGVSLSRESPREYVDDIVYSKDGRFVLKLHRSTGEATITDYESGESARLQGAFDLKEQSTYEWGVSISANGKRLAIQANDGSIRGFELGEQQRPFRQYGQIAWVSPDDSRFIARSFKDGREGLGLRDALTGQLQVHVDTDGRELTRVRQSADGKYLLGLRSCQDPSTSPQCVAVLPLKNGTAFELPYKNRVTPLMADDLMLFRDGERLRVYRVGLKTPVFEMPASPPPAADQGSDRASMLRRLLMEIENVDNRDSIELGSDRQFATKRLVGDTANVEIYKVVDGEARSYVKLPPVQTNQGASIAFVGGGKFLRVKAANRMLIWDLRGASAVLAFDADSESDAYVNAKTNRVISRRNTESVWEIRDLSPGAPVKSTLPAEFQIESSGNYAWAMSKPGRLELRSLSEVNSKPLVVEGAARPSAYSASVVVIEFPDEGRVKGFEVASGKKLMDMTIASIAPYTISPGGRFIIDKYQRLIPIDSAEMFKAAKTWVGRDLSDSERCTSLDDKDACVRMRRVMGVASR